MKELKLITSIVCSYLGVEEDLLFQKSRKQLIVQARYISMEIASKITIINDTNIGAYFNKDHATVWHARRKVSDLRETEKEYSKMYNDIYFQCSMLIKVERDKKTRVKTTINTEQLINLISQAYKISPDNILVDNNQVYILGNYT